MNTSAHLADQHPQPRALTRRDLLASAAVTSALLTLGSLPGYQPNRDDKTIELWTLALSPWFDDYLHERIRAFEIASGCKVNWVDIPFDALERKLIAAAAAGRAPDVVNMSDLNFARFVSMGAFTGLDTLLPNPAEATYLEGALRICRVPTRGRRDLLGVPWYVTTQSLIANRSLLEKGLGPSWPTRLNVDWLGLIDLASEFRSKTNAFLFSQPLGQESEVPQMMLAHGVIPFITTNGRLHAGLTQPAVADYLSRWVLMYRAGHLPREAATRGHAHLTEMYQRGEAALVNTGPQFLKRIRDAAPAIYEASVVLPGMTGRLGRGHIPVMALAVTKQSESPKLAAALASHLTSPESQTAFCKLTAILPSTPESLKDPYFRRPTDAEVLGPDGKLVQARAVSAAGLPLATAFTCGMETWPSLRRVFEESFKGVLLAGRDLNAMLIELNVEWDRILSQADPVGMEVIPTPAPIALPRRDLWVTAIEEVRN
ncbi:MAG: extracellular solute-binding protein [Planctomycetes bacterium]|nr:extracellular solute-binding protein [Planctomycetota bacterium]